MFGGSSHHSTSPQEEAEALVSLMNEFSSRDQAAFNFSVCERGCTCAMRRRVVLLAILLLLTAAGVTAQAAVVSQAVEANSRTEEGQTVGTGGAPFGPATLAPAPRKQEQLAYLQDAYLDDDYDDYEDEDLEQPSQDSSRWGSEVARSCAPRDRRPCMWAQPVSALFRWRRDGATTKAAVKRAAPCQEANRTSVLYLGHSRLGPTQPQALLQPQPQALSQPQPQPQLQVQCSVSVRSRCCVTPGGGATRRRMALPHSHQRRRRAPGSAGGWPGRSLPADGMLRRQADLPAPGRPRCRCQGTDPAS